MEVALYIVWGIVLILIGARGLLKAAVLFCTRVTSCCCELRQVPHTTPQAPLEDFINLKGSSQVSANDIQ